jgi:alkaline phosphatase
MKLFKILIFGLFLVLITGCSDTTKKSPKNIIIFIGDGMGYNHVDVASFYQFGETGKQVYEAFPVKMGMSTYMVGGEVYNPDSVWVNFNYVKKKPTDSAASGTAIATGTKTYKSGVSVDSAKMKLLTVLDRAELIGKSTGVVSTVPFSNATPASFVAHNESRYNYREIAKEMIMESKVDVIMGGGHPLFNPDGSHIKSHEKRVVGEKESYDLELSNQMGNSNNEEVYRYVGGKVVWNLLVEGNAGSDADNDGIDDPWDFIQDRDVFQKYGSGETPKRVLGVFKSGQSTQVERVNTLDAGKPFSAPLNIEVPTLEEMTNASINILDDNPNGFVMMVEGGAIDWVAHSNLLHRTIEEIIDFNKAVEAACNWVEKNSSWNETLIIVTADHETGYLIGPGSNKVVEWISKDHTNSLVPFYAKGAGSSNFRDVIKGNDNVRGSYIDNTDIGNVVSDFLLSDEN